MFSRLFNSRPAKDEAGGNELVKAALDGDAEKLELLLRSGIPINSQTQEGYTGLMLAAGRGQTNIVKFLLKERADVNMQAKHKETALHLAAGFGPTAMVELLLGQRVGHTQVVGSRRHGTVTVGQQKLQLHSGARLTPGVPGICSAQ